MHVTPTELRVVQRGDLLLRFALLDSAAYVLAELPAGGTSGTALELPCREQHWGVVLRGQVELCYGADQRHVLAAGTAFHVPAGETHYFVAERRAVLAGFVPLDDEGPGAIERAVYSPAGAPPSRDEDGYAALGPVIVTKASQPKSVESGAILTEFATMGRWIFCRSTFGQTSGFGSSWCDLPHWGIVVSGSVAIEYENDVEVLSTGDVYLCPSGPPGHKFEVADAATIVDFTPRAAYGEVQRVVDWRPKPAALDTGAGRAVSG